MLVAQQDKLGERLQAELSRYTVILIELKDDVRRLHEDHTLLATKEDIEGLKALLQGGGTVQTEGGTYVEHAEIHGGDLVPGYKVVNIHEARKRELPPAQLLSSGKP